MACESFVEHLVGSLYFLQRTLFLRFSQISMSLAIYLYLRAGVLACRGWLISLQFSGRDCGQGCGCGSLELHQTGPRWETVSMTTTVFADPVNSQNVKNLDPTEKCVNKCCQLCTFCC